MAKQRYSTLDLDETFDVGLRLDSKDRSGFTFRTNRSELTSVLYRRPESPKPWTRVWHRFHMSDKRCVYQALELFGLYFP